MDDRRHSSAQSLGLLILRVGVGGFMITHGWGKLKMVLAGDFDQFADPIGLGTGLSLVLVMSAEFMCALLVVLGLATRLAAVPIVFAMGVAAFVVHAGDPWTMGEAARLFMAGESQSWSAKEPALLFMTVFLALIFTGPGRLSVDALIWSRWRRRRMQTEPRADLKEAPPAGSPPSTAPSEQPRHS